MKLQKRFTKINGIRITYWVRKADTEKWVVLLHGAGMDSKMFNKQLLVLPDAYNVLLWDARGHGESDNFQTAFSIKQLRTDLLHILHLENCAQAIFVGQSMGGNLIQNLAYYHPDMVQKMILIGCTRNTNRVSVWEKLLIKATPFLLRLYPWRWLVKQSAQICGLRIATRQYAQSALNRVGKKRFIQVLTATMQALQEDQAYRFNKPILLLCGRYDNSGNIRKIVTQWAEHEPLCKLHIIDNAAHNANQDNPESVNKLMSTFL